MEFMIHSNMPKKLKLYFTCYLWRRDALSKQT